MKLNRDVGGIATFTTLNVLAPPECSIVVVILVQRRVSATGASALLILSHMTLLSSQGANVVVPPAAEY